MIEITLWLWQIRIDWHWVEWSPDWPNHEAFIDFNVFLDDTELLGLDHELCKDIEHICLIDMEANMWMKAEEKVAWN